MADEARSTGNFGESRYQADATVNPFSIRQGPTGLCEVYDNASAALATSSPTYKTVGEYKVAKTNGINFLKGSRVYFDYSARLAHYKRVDDRDFFMGLAKEDAADTGATVQVVLNADRLYDIDLLNDPYVTAPTGTQALGGFLPPQFNGGSLRFALSATNEVQKVDALSKAGFSKDANAIIEIIANVVANGAAGTQDISLGIADATAATDADTIANSVFIHLNGGDLNIYAESDDTTANEVAATDTTIDYAVGTPFHIWIDMRTPTALAFYINAVRVLSGTTFNINGSSPTWKLLIHMEKTATVDVFSFDIDRAQVRFAEQ